MTKEEAIEWLNTDISRLWNTPTNDLHKEALEMAIEALKQESCEMTVEQYRQRMIQAFHKTDCDELIALVAIPTEKEFEHLEWLLEKHWPRPKSK